MTGAGVEEDIDMAAAAAGAEATVDLYLTVHDVAGRGVVNPVLGGGVSQVSRFTPLPLNKYKRKVLFCLFFFPSYSAVTLRFSTEIDSCKHAPSILLACPCR